MELFKIEKNVEINNKFYDSITFLGIKIKKCNKLLTLEQRFKTSLTQNSNRLKKYYNDKLNLLKEEVAYFQKMQYEIDKFKTLGIEENSQRSPRIIVSLTSYPKRMYGIHYVIYSLLTQTLKPDMVILWLSETEFPNKEADLGQNVLSLVKNGLTIMWTKDNTKSYKKLTPSLETFPNDIIITVDDDIICESSLVEKLYQEYLQNPNLIHTARAHKVTFNQKHELLPYSNWNWNIKNTNVSFSNFLTGGAGTLYPPNSLYKDITNNNLYTLLAPNADDIWFWAMAVLNNTKINVVYNEYKYPKVMGSQEECLCNSNVIENQNDVQLSNVLNHYPQILETLLKEHKE